MERVLKIIAYVIIVAALIAASTFYYAEEIYHKMVAEDGVFENITALVLLGISILFLLRFIKTRETRNKYWTVLNVLIIVGAFFGFGEEISWGQRILSIESGEFFVQNNLQNETNLHNLEINGVKINKLIFSQGMVLVFGFYFVLSLLFYRRWNFFQNLVDLFGIQLPKIKHTVIMLVCTGIILMVPDLRIWELWEALFVVMLLLVFVEPVNEKESVLS
ncbi:hypothetical protein OU798_09305 [Prolixibacteraceae bacterium Z1-6]|uniref:Uncharacterized protein n=1 Tax=Draconibacterium aestuarii TaxID=2998507 RepID=A0A9X3J631_9BACT|nr:hypothetical protein [Prolixibacteraceae bacterium Z1-6]